MVVTLDIWLMWDIHVWGLIIGLWSVRHIFSLCCLERLLIVWKSILRGWRVLLVMWVLGSGNDCWLRLSDRRWWIGVWGFFWVGRGWTNTPLRWCFCWVFWVGLVLASTTMFFLLYFFYLLIRYIVITFEDVINFFIYLFFYNWIWWIFYLLFLFLKFEEFNLHW